MKQRDSRVGTSLPAAMTGKNMIMVAVLLANSVKQARKAVINITAAAGGTSANGWRWPPIHLREGLCDGKKNNMDTMITPVTASETYLQDNEEGK
ncbi:hypothetical protein EYF80_016497 [Liparis tanakae]|uniref:Uncharacterized protein n=1 Tax=Liparis tanakae TaxID=230148 RepID=A0A4Z2I7P5_9TELE|nr:hypothetical protein EYF80_016497 [Liparis tanakae]